MKKLNLKKMAIVAAMLGIMLSAGSASSHEMVFGSICQTNSPANVYYGWSYTGVNTATSLICAAPRAYEAISLAEVYVENLGTGTITAYADSIHPTGYPTSYKSVSSSDSGKITLKPIDASAGRTVTTWSKGTISFELSMPSNSRVYGFYTN